ncbi:MAG: murein biosynthesis integral membrane protein MurJ [Myxococcaceae bacterium]
MSEPSQAVAVTAVAPGPKRQGGALWVSAGMLLSRVMGFVRVMVFARYLGTSLPAGAFNAALRIPNFLQNLFGEGVLSASFIPVYASLSGKEEREEADKVAGAVFGLLSLVTAVLVALGMWASPLFVDLITDFKDQEAREIAIQLVRILFPGTGILVLSAWCLGILNSHRKFFLSYAAPVAWNLAMIATLIVFGGRVTQLKLVEYLAYATVVGSALQFVVQLPSVFKLLGHFRPTLSIASAHVRQVLRSFGPVIVGRGVVQISALVDTNYASFLGARAVSAITYAQTLYLLPISLFGMAVSAAELPAMSQTSGTTEEVAAKLRKRLSAGLARIAFFVVPSAAAFLFLGDVVASVLQQGKFLPGDTRYVWFLLMGSSVGLVAATAGRLYASAFYALKDTRRPLYFATARVALGVCLAYYAVHLLPQQLGVPQEMGAVGVTVASGIVAWIECTLLRRALAKRIGPARLPFSRTAILWGSAIVASAVGLAVKLALVHVAGADERVFDQWGGGFLGPPKIPGVLTAVLVLGPYGVVYFALTALFRVPESQAVFRRVLRRQA